MAEIRARVKRPGRKWSGEVAEPDDVGMGVVMLFWGSLVLGVFLLLFAVWWPMRDYVRIRRKDCCGKGCGCLFPVNLEDVKKD